MNAPTTPLFREDGETGDLIDTYVSALVARDAPAALATLSADAVFQSPFHTYRYQHLPSVFRARCGAFGNVTVNSVVRAPQRAVIFWTATVADSPLEAVELLSVSAGVISRVDVYLRPAGVLDAVRDAMAAAWQ